MLEWGKATAGAPAGKRNKRFRSFYCCLSLSQVIRTPGVEERDAQHRRLASDLHYHQLLRECPGFVCRHSLPRFTAATPAAGDSKSAPRKHSHLQGRDLPCAAGLPQLSICEYSLLHLLVSRNPVSASDCQRACHSQTCLLKAMEFPSRLHIRTQ